MKTLTTAVICGLALCSHALGQGTFLFDQQSSTDEAPPVYGQGGIIQSILSPWGQSFTPSLSSVAFIRLKLGDGNTDDGLGVSMYINLRSGSISGPIIATSSTASMPTLYLGVTQFDFAAPVPVNPGVTYYYQPVIASGGTWRIVGGTLYPYGPGTAYENGHTVAYDHWFREGTIPEPGTTSLLLLGLGLLHLKKPLKAIDFTQHPSHRCTQIPLTRNLPKDRCSFEKMTSE